MADRKMRMHWFLTHISPIIGMVGNGATALSGLIKIVESGWYLLDVAFCGTACLLLVGIFCRRKEYTATQYKLCIAFWSEMTVYNALTGIVGGVSAATCIGELSVFAVVLIYYFRRKEIFCSGEYEYYDGAHAKVKNEASAMQKTEIISSFVTNSAQPEGQSLKPEVNTGIRYCTKCGYRLKEDSVFCSNCGIKIEQ